MVQKLLLIIKQIIQAIKIEKKKINHKNKNQNGIHTIQENI